MYYICIATNNTPILLLLYMVQNNFQFNIEILLLYLFIIHRDMRQNLIKNPN